MKYYKPLDGLRGVAVLMVLIYHFTRFSPDSIPESVFKMITDIGYIGVDLFFVLSGFLISGILWRMKINKHSLCNFYIRRTLRVFPVYFLLLIVMFLLVNKSFISDHYISSYNNQWYFWGYVSNILIGLDGFKAAPWLTHTWSLAVEEQFYLFFPFIIGFINKSRWIIIGILLVILLRIFFWQAGLKALNYTFVFTRMDSFLLGALLAYLVKESRSIPSIIHLLSFALFLIILIYTKGLKPSGFVMQIAGYTITSFFFFSLIHLAITNSNFITNSVLSNGILPFFGKYSYAQYLFHVPVLKVTEIYFGEVITLMDQMQFYAICFPATVILSVISWNFLERPFLRLKARYTYESSTGTHLA